MFFLDIFWGACCLDIASHGCWRALISENLQRMKIRERIMHLCLADSGAGFWHCWRIWARDICRWYCIVRIIVQRSWSLLLWWRHRCLDMPSQFFTEEKVERELQFLLGYCWRCFQSGNRCFCWRFFISYFRWFLRSVHIADVQLWLLAVFVSAACLWFPYLRFF